ncbi:Uncharacterised protein [Chlamydia trachomatis]|nr:Uncharacterised protein [Chlamydia trachomatis]
MMLSSELYKLLNTPSVAFENSKLKATNEGKSCFNSATGVCTNIFGSEVCNFSIFKFSQ